MARSLGMALAQFDALPESERSYWIADWQIKRLECPDCGRPVDECSDPTRRFYPFRRICYATMEAEAAQEAYAALHAEGAAYHDGSFTNWHKERTDEFPYGAGSGVSIGVTDVDVTPWDTFTTDVDASPVRPSVAEQSPGEQQQPRQ